MSILSQLKAIDYQLLLLINHNKSPFLDWAMPLITEIGSIVPFLLLFIAWRLYKGDNKERIFWIVGIISIIAADAVCARLLKPLFARPRPYNVLDGIYIFKKGSWLITTEELRNGLKLKFSFPSCHAVNTWTAAGYISLFYKKAGLIVAVIAFLVSYSRIYLGVHYPGDVFFGALTGIMMGLLFALIVKKALNLNGKNNKNFY